MYQLRSFLKGHARSILQDYMDQAASRIDKGHMRIPFDNYLRQYYQSHKSLGPKDRNVITEAVYKYLRNESLLGYLSKKTDVDSKLKQLTEHEEIEQALKNNNIPYHIRCSCPRDLFDLLSQTYGERTAFQYMLAMNTKAPLTIRINPIKTTRDKVYNHLSKNLDLAVKKTEVSPYGILLGGKSLPNIKQNQLFLDGHIEIQDEASQVSALLVECGPSQRILDYCAGSGGKTLTFAHRTQNTGQIFLHDIREKILINARKRCARAGVNNIVIAESERQIKGGKFDWILLDMPCSGLGTLRRNPDSKYFWNRKQLDELVFKQREIFEKAIRHLRDDGHIVYVTCSLLEQENQNQIEHFCQKYGMMLKPEKQFQSLPQVGGMDAFYAATLIFK